MKIDKKVKKQNGYYHYNDHKLTNRRDFIAQGLISFTAFAATPTLLGFGFQKAFAANCGGGGNNSGMVPFMAFDMAGGAALPANFLVGSQGGPEDLIPSYDLLGWDPRANAALDKRFGLPMSATYSGFLQGLLTNMSAGAQANFRMGSFCHFSQDDSRSNQMNAGTLALSAGARGLYVTNGMGSMKSNSGGKSRPVLDSVALKPTFVQSIDDVLGATDFGGPSFEGVSVSKKAALAKAGKALSTVQAKDFLQYDGGKVLQELSECAYEKSLEFVSGVTGMDPRQDQSSQQVYGINNNTNSTDGNAVAAAIAMNCIKGNSGPSVWTLGGCDYHDGTSTTGDRKDQEMGVQVGRAIELAHRLQKPFFFQLLTDGGCGATKGTRRWRSDSGDKSMTVIGYYSPKGAPKMMRQQVGYYTSGQGAERSTLIGGSPSMVGYAVLANYMNVCGKLGDFASVAPGVFEKKEELESVLIFEG